VAEPVGDRERAELGEVAVVEHEDEGAGAGTEALDGVAVAARKIPDVAHGEIGDLGLVLRINGRDAAAPFDHIGPFGGVGVPVKLAKRSGLKRHVDAGKLIGDAKPGDVRFLGRAAGEGLGFDEAERIAEGGKLGPRRAPAAPARSSAQASPTPIPPRPTTSHPMPLLLTPARCRLVRGMK
jgi:hypothetical protein